MKTKFSDFNLSCETLKAITILQYQTPTEVQTQLIPLLFKNQDCIVQSKTGSGKTAAFAIPLCDLVDWDENKPQVLVLTPTRELALQVKEDLFNIGRFKKIKVEAIFGKASFEGQKKQLKQKTHMVVGTPGRIFDHIEQGSLDVSAIKYLVIDEADEMFNMGFIDQVEAIIEALPKDRTTLLLSATMPKSVSSLCENYMQSPTSICITDTTTKKPQITQDYYLVNNEDKFNLLKNILILENPDSCIVFCNTQQQVDDIFYDYFALKKMGERLHGGMYQKDRIEIITEFKHNYFRYLVATDVASRGLDIDKVALIVNFDMPEDSATYTHRIGRTGRVNHTGKAISFVEPSEKNMIIDIENETDFVLSLQPQPQYSVVKQAQKAFDDKIKTLPKIKKTKSIEFKKEILKLHINAGKKTKMRASDIVGAICSIDGISFDDIGIINIIDVSSFVEILNNKGDIVFKALQELPIKGRIRKVSKANKSVYEVDYQKQF